MKKEKTKSKVSDLVWISKEVDPKKVMKTPVNYKIKTKLGEERLKESLRQFGLAGNMVVNYHPTKKGYYILIDGNSRLEQALTKKAQTVWVSLPSRPLSTKEFKLMSAMFDFAKAGEVDVDRIKQDLGATGDFFKAWHMDVNMEAIDKIGKKGKVVLPKSKAKVSGTEDIGTNSTVMINLFYDRKRAEKFHAQNEKLLKKYKMDNISDVVFKKFMS